MQACSFTKSATAVPPGWFWLVPTSAPSTSSLDALEEPAVDVPDDLTDL